MGHRRESSRSAPLESNAKVHSTRSRGEADIVLPAAEVPKTDQRKLKDGKEPHHNQNRMFQKVALLEHVKAAKLLVSVKKGTGGKGGKGKKKNGALEVLEPASKSKRKTKVPGALSEFFRNDDDSSSDEESVIEENEGGPSRQRPKPVETLNPPPNPPPKSRAKASTSTFSVEAFLFDTTISEETRAKRMAQLKELRELDRKAKDEEHAREMELKREERKLAKTRGGERRREEVKMRAKANIAEVFAKKEAEANLARAKVDMKAEDNLIKERERGHCEEQGGSAQEGLRAP